MKKLSVSYQCHVVSNKKNFEFDADKLCNTSPYFDGVDQVKRGMFIESITINEGQLLIVGWVIGDLFSIEGVSKSQTILERTYRQDVNEAFDVLNQPETGFHLLVNLHESDDTSFSIVLNELKVDFTVYANLPNLFESVNNSNDISRNSNDLLIVGGAPSVKTHLNEVLKFKGDIWALNDSIFYLEKEGVQVDKLVIADQRFIEKNIEILPDIMCKSLLAADYLNFYDTLQKDSRIFNVQIVGRNGISDSIKQAFHGCTVAHLALQVARLLRYKRITTAGIILDFPTNYERVDGSKTMPEYVHNAQVLNVMSIVQLMRREGFDIKALEKNSNINFF